MERFIKNILYKLGIHSSRTKGITKHVLLSFIFKGGSILANFLIVPVTIRFLNNENYGVWLTISSLVAWFYFFDIGLGHGLRNKFAEEKAKGDLDNMQGYVSTAYFSLMGICLCFFLVALVFSKLVDWSVIFNTNAAMDVELQLIMPIVFGCFSLQLVLGLVTAIYTADQRPSVQPKISFIGAVTSLIAVWLLTLYAKESLLIFAIAFSAIPVLVLLLFNVLAFTNSYSEYRPKFKFVKRHYFKNIFGLGASFFIIQLSMVILNSTDNFIIAQLLGPKEVVPYNIAYKYFSIALIFITIVLTPYWSSFTEAFVKDDITWIKRSMSNLMKFVGFTIGIILLMLLMANVFYDLWIGDLVEIPYLLSVSMACYFSVSIFYSPFNYFINGLGKIKLHMYSFLIGALLNIPLSIFLVKYMNLGVKGVILATTICILPNSILFPLQYRKLINKKARGIWNK